LPTEGHRLITCFLPSGRAIEVLERLRKEHGLASMAYHHARGVGTGTRRGRSSFFSSEREIITVLAPESRADELFRFLYFAAGLDAPNTGIIFMERLLRATPMVTPEAAKTRDQGPRN
jgi:hypothetical protein